MTIDNISELIKGNYCQFEYLRAGNVYYSIARHTEDGKAIEYIFRIPLDDLGGATLNNREKAISLMRWIRKANEGNELIFYKQYDLPTVSE